MEIDLNNDSVIYAAKLYQRKMSKDGVLSYLNKNDFNEEEANYIYENMPSISKNIKRGDKKKTNSLKAISGYVLLILGVMSILGLIGSLISTGNLSLVGLGITVALLVAGSKMIDAF